MRASHSYGVAQQGFQTATDVRSGLVRFAPPACYATEQPRSTQYNNCTSGLTSLHTHNTHAPAPHTLTGARNACAHTRTCAQMMSSTSRDAPAGMGEPSATMAASTSYSLGLRVRAGRMGVGGCGLRARAHHVGSDPGWLMCTASSSQSDVARPTSVPPPPPWTNRRHSHVHPAPPPRPNLHGACARSPQSSARYPPCPQPKPPYLPATKATLPARRAPPASPSLPSHQLIFTAGSSPSASATSRF